VAVAVQHIVVRQPVLAAEDADGAVAHAIARRVGAGIGRNLGDEFQVAAGAAAVLAVPAGAGAEFMGAEEQREAHFGDLQAANLMPPAACHSPAPGQPSPW